MLCTLEYISVHLLSSEGNVEGAEWVLDQRLRVRLFSMPKSLFSQSRL